MSKLKCVNGTVANWSKLDYERLRERIGIVKYRAIVTAYGEWVCRTAQYKDHGLGSVVKGHGKLHSPEAWNAEYPNDTPENCEIFFRQYLAEHNMESMLGGEHGAN